MSATVERCMWSDLPVDQCGHCIGALGLPIEPSPAEPPRIPGRVVWSETMHRTRETAPQRPASIKTDTGATGWVKGPQIGQNECGCGKPTRDNATVCDDCTEELRRALGDVTALAEELDISITRQRSAAIDGGSKSAQSGIPWHEKASEARRNLHALLVSWTRLCAEEGVGHGPAELPADNLPALSGWLLHRVDGLARHDAGMDAHDEITDAVAECERIIFWKRRTRTYLGACEQRVIDDDGQLITDSCTGDVYADEGAQVGWCEDCAQGVTVVVRQAELNRRLDGMLYTAAELARLSVILGIDAPRDTVRKKVHYWHRRKLIAQRSTTHDGAPMFRYGEVRAMLYAEFMRDTA